MTSPLSSLLVIELASVLAGPLVGMFCAELGARVIKVENARTGGDVTRSWKTSHEDERLDISAYFSCCNMGKESIALDFTNSNDLELLRTLLLGADVVVQNFKAGDAEKFGLDANSILSYNSRAIIISFTGYGDTNKRTGYDALIQAESGIMSINGEVDSLPLKLPIAFVDILAAHHAKEALLLALMQRMNTGIGQHISISLFDAALSSLANQASNYLATGIVPSQSGSSHPNIVPYGNLYKSADEVLILPAIGTDKQFIEFCRILGCTELAERFPQNHQRVIHRTAIEETLTKAIRTMNADNILEQCHEQQLPVARVRSIAEALNTPEARELMLHTQNANHQYSALRSSLFPTTHHISMRPPPHFNQHNDALRNEFDHKLKT